MDLVDVVDVGSGTLFHLAHAFEIYWCCSGLNAGVWFCFDISSEILPCLARFFATQVNSPGQKQITSVFVY